MSLDMLGHIDSVFQSVGATRTTTASSYVEGEPVVTNGASTSHTVNIQPLSDKEMDSLVSGGERVLDARKIYVNDGDLYSILPTDNWRFDGITGEFKTVKLDNRPWRNYCKAVVVRRDG